MGFWCFWFILLWRFVSLITFHLSTLSTTWKKKWPGLSDGDMVEKKWPGLSDSDMVEKKWPGLSDSDIVTGRLITFADARTQLEHKCSGTDESLGLNSNMHILASTKLGFNLVKKKKKHSLWLNSALPSLHCLHYYTEMIWCGTSPIFLKCIF